MEFEFLQTSKAIRKAQTKRRWSWPRFWLAFSCGGLLIIGTLALLKAIGGDATTKNPQLAPPVAAYAPPTSQEILPDVLREPPGNRPVPEAVNEFLRDEQSLNSGRLDLLRQRQVKVQQIDFSSQCLPQWDFRSPKREVIWFYHYRSGATTDNHMLTVFGAVDGLGKPLFQHPPMAGDHLALLDSQYVSLKWIALDQPRVALIAAANGPWPDCGSVIDLFLVNSPENGTGARFWRFQDKAFAESPPCSPLLISFRDADGDGFLDLCSFHLRGAEGEEQPIGFYHPYEEAGQSFAETPSSMSKSALGTLLSDYQRILGGEKLDDPFLVGASATESVFDGEPAAAAETEEPKY
ncbi:MAG: hypothetical protein ACI8T1_001199 [Verrucomicrobiales bacterium]